MPTPTYIVQSGDMLLVPEKSLSQLTVEWQQNVLDRKANYHTGFVPVKGKSGDENQVLLFIQSEWYQDVARMASIANKVGDHYELKVDGKTRYGQKNAKGEARFIVYHDTSRNPYQHRFMNPVLRQNALGLGRKVAQMLGVAGGVMDLALSQVQALVGDKLREW
ncbi:hypothetical protein FRC09_010355 [Ceratobasidium sp. 395]|nr:hypothetical protein FRC09_010355 [Ceratobasidium sp. 395]